MAIRKIDFLIHKFKIQVNDSSYDSPIRKERKKDGGKKQQQNY
jgi:hypothetical protein